MIYRLTKVGEKYINSSWASPCRIGKYHLEIGILTRAQGYKTFFMLISVEHDFQMLISIIKALQALHDAPPLR